MQIIEILNPVKKYIPVVASIPHSGMYIPQDIARICKKHHLQTLRNTDWHLGRLYDFLSELGIHIIKTNCSRYVIDVNRPLTKPLFGRYQKCAIYETNTWGEVIYRRPPRRQELRNRVSEYYIPYHKALRAITTQLLRDFGKVYLFDLHSFLGPISNDVCLGDFFGKSCSRGLLDTVYQSFTANGYDTVINNVYSGGHITKHYSRLPYIETLQIEIRYTTYLEDEGFDEGVIPKPEGLPFQQAREKLHQTFSTIIKDIV